jgi:CHAD domain-containing protein
MRKDLPWVVDGGIAENLRAVLPLMVTDLFAEGRRCVREQVSGTELHDLRLQAKQLRYTLDVASSAYGAALQERLQQLKALQDHLGAISDALATRDLLRGEEGPEAARQAARRLLRARAEEGITAFREFWTRIFDAEGEEQRWTKYFQRAGGQQRVRTPRKQLQA